MPKAAKQKRLWLLLGAALAPLIGLLAVVDYLDRPTGLTAARQVAIGKGMSARGIGEALERQGLIRSARLFEWTVRWRGVAGDLEAGTYRIDGTSTTRQIAATLLKAPIQTRRVTIPEGLTRHQIAGLMQREIALDSTRFVALAEEASLLAELGVDAATLEGYLFPETYFFDAHTTEEAAIRRMVAEFGKVFSDTLAGQLKTVGLDLHQAVTLASIVELEAVAHDERPIIAAVFHRRLELNRLLESCATVEYALGVHKERLTNADLRVESPFNTYIHRGLPPAPIGNPGLASLRATLFPADTDYLYFVARGDGRHIFSHTHVEHSRAKRAVRRGAPLASKSGRSIP